MRLRLPDSLIDAVSNRQRVTGAPHDLYHYPARFAPVFACEAIKSFTKPGDLVLDPFCGAGTTLVEALSLGRRAVGMDINSLATFLTRAKTTAISVHDKRAIKEWITTLDLSTSTRRYHLEPVPDAELAYYQRNLPHEPREFLSRVVEQIPMLPTLRQQRFVRFILLGLGQWALDCKTRIPSIAELQAEFHRRLDAAIENYFSFTSIAAQNHQVPRCRLSSFRRIINCSSHRAADDQRIPKSWLPAKLVLTSPPYPGVHVLYHRWQIFGRWETPAPFWLANQRDGAGESYYLLGPRQEDQLGTYFRRLESVFSSVRNLLDSDSLVVQLVAFSDPSWQLPQYLQTMKEAGYRELKAECQTGRKLAGRIWRTVPGRKWYANNRGDIAPSKEVLLLHKLDIRRSVRLA
jgi:DNA modification methylase